jgi:hypothetical protein
LRKISVLEETASLANDGAELERDRLKMRIDALAAFGLQHGEQLIAQRIASRFGRDMSVGTSIHFISQRLSWRRV